MIEWMLAAALVAADAGDLSPDGEALLSALAASIAQVRARQSQEPPPKDDRELILRLGELDQAPRKVIGAFDFSRIPEPERARVLARASALIEAVDREDLAALVKLTPPEGWFLRSRFGDRTAWAALDIVQHGDLATQERYLPVLGRLVSRGEVAGESYAMMYDRVEIQHDRPQLYGTQFRCDGGRWRPYPIKLPDALDDRRRGMGFEMSFQAYKAGFDAAPSCPQTRRPPPPGMKLD